MTTPAELLSSIREEMLGEARSSPGLLTDIANLERYLAETYSSRSFVELLQNADDARANRFLLTRHSEWLVCANDGLTFSRQDFYSLCRSASSNKRRGETIGYRGIGFKSIVGLASTVHLLSGNLNASFSRDLTQKSLGVNGPTPLIRIPHPLALEKDQSVLVLARELEQSGYTTIFILGGLDNERVQDEFDQFDSDYLLFLRNVVEAIILMPEKRHFLCERTSLNLGSQAVSVTGPDRHSAWQLHSTEDCALAFSMNEGRPVPLNATSAVVHAFLPTLETTGLGIRINADFSTDPSRTRIVFDDATLKRIDDVAASIATKVSATILDDGGSSDVLACLTPTADLSTLSLQKRSFKTELLIRLRHRLEHLRDLVLISPSWLNRTDAMETSHCLNRKIIFSDGVNGLLSTAFMHYLGVKTLALQSVLKVAEKTTLTRSGCAEVIAHSKRNVAAGIGIKHLMDKPIWEGRHQPVLRSTLHAILAKGFALDLGFVESLKVVGLGTGELATWLRSADLSTDAIATLLPDLDMTKPIALPMSETSASREPVNGPRSDGEPFDPLIAGGAPSDGSAIKHITSRSLPAWRGAEQYVAQVLEEAGYHVEDRSRQNLGYDLYVEKLPRKFYIEVKLLDYAGQPFVITPNEQAVARECADSYILALALRDKAGTHLQFVNNPVESLNFIRQCRQWVWECSDYEFAPTQYSKDSHEKD